MKVAIVTPEAIPFSKTGGLADVTGTLFKEYQKMSLDAYLFLPFYKKTRECFKDKVQDTGIEIDIPLGNTIKKCNVFTDSNIFFTVNDEYFDRDGLYGTSIGEHPDNDMRYVFFCKSVLEICKRLDINPDVIHCNDWQTALIPLYLKTLYREESVFEKTRSVLTIHNLGYQGLFGAQTMEITGFNQELFNPEGIEFYGKVNFLKAGIIGADIITTVSMTYAKEILSPEHGFGLEGVLKRRTDSIIGIPNGIDYNEWNSANDKFLPQTYNESDLSGKLKCKEALMEKCSLEGATDMPLLCFIGRLSNQKGIDILSNAAPELIARGANIVIIGEGEEVFQAALRSLGDMLSGRLYVYTGFDDALAHLAYAGSDIFLMPSKYEPCGLGQMIAMHYGTIPVARRTGGIIDAVKEGETGFLFDEYSSKALIRELDRALTVYNDRELWQNFIKNAMSRDFSWGNSAKMYLEIYSGKTA